MSHVPENLFLDAVRAAGIAFSLYIAEAPSVIFGKANAGMRKSVTKINTMHHMLIAQPYLSSVVIDQKIQVNDTSMGRIDQVMEPTSVSLRVLNAEFLGSA